MRPRRGSEALPAVWLDCGGQDAQRWIEEISDWRYLFQLCWVLTASGYRVCLPLARPGDTASEDLADTARLAGVEWGCRERAGVFVHRFVVGEDVALGPAETRLRFGISEPPPSGRYRVLPFPLHRRVALSSAYGHIERLAACRRRRCRLLFSGSMRHTDYRETVCGRPGRDVLLAALYAGLRPDEFHLLTSGRQFDGLFLNPLATRDDSLIVLGLGRLPCEWLCTLALADCFLCLPGMVMPMCHNAVEAMAVGVVPVLNYTEWFDPPLQDGLNCFAFHDTSDVCSVVRRVLQASPDTVDRMRLAVRAYYAEYLREDAVCRRLTGLGGGTACVITEQRFDGIGPHSVIFSHQGQPYLSSPDGAGTASARE